MIWPYSRLRFAGNGPATLKNKLVQRGHTECACIVGIIVQQAYMVCCGEVWCSECFQYILYVADCPTARSQVRNHANSYMVPPMMYTAGNGNSFPFCTSPCDIICKIVCSSRCTTKTKRYKYRSVFLWRDIATKSSCLIRYLFCNPSLSILTVHKA